MKRGKRYEAVASVLRIAALLFKNVNPACVSKAFDSTTI